jgi:transposase
MTKEMVSITEEQVLAIPALLDSGMTCVQIAEKYGCHERTINKWVNRLRAEGITVNTRKGRPKMKLTAIVNNENEHN